MFKIRMPQILLSVAVCTILLGVFMQFAQALPSSHGLQRVLGVATSAGEPCTGKTYTLPTTLDAKALGPGLHIVQEEPQYYSLAGNSIGQIRANIEACQLLKQPGGYHATTTYTMTWSYDVVAASGQCTVTNAAVALHLNQHLPKLQGVNQLGSESPEWDAYYRQLLKHEDHHIALDTAAATALFQKLSLLSDACMTIHATAQDVISESTAILDARNKQYDAATEHGALEGAIL